MSDEAPYDDATMTKLADLKKAEEDATEPLKGVMSHKAEGVGGLAKWSDVNAPMCARTYKNKTKVYCMSWADHTEDSQFAPFCMTSQVRSRIRRTRRAAPAGRPPRACTHA